jgi:hypothetical protein
VENSPVFQVASSVKLRKTVHRDRRCECRTQPSARVVVGVVVVVVVGVVDGGGGSGVGNGGGGGSGGVRRVPT